MEPFRKHVALSIDGGGIRGTMVAKALAVVEASVNRAWFESVHLAAGTSTGSIIAGAIACEIPAERIHELYVSLGDTIFKKSLRSLWPLSGYKYPSEPLKSALRSTLGELRMGELWGRPRKLDLVITVRDLVENRTRFIKPWKEEYQDWKVWYAALCSSTVPTYFPVVDGRYVDGGVGSYTNPCYYAAYEADVFLGWDPAETTLISIGTGREALGLKPGEADKFNALEWVRPLIDTFLCDANDQQVRVVDHFYPDLDFRRFQVDLDPPIAIDDPAGIPELTRWGEVLGEMILNDQVDEKAHGGLGVPEAMPA